MRRLTAALVGMAVVLAGCTEGPLASPMCGDEVAETVVLMAQSVPDATLVPCIDALPAGWQVVVMDVGSAGTTMRVGNERAGMTNFLEVSFAAECDVGGAVEVPSDEDGTRRFEEVEEVATGFVGTRTYQFDGGCTTYHFELTEEGWSAMVNDASVALTFVTRAELVEVVADRTHGAVERL